MRKTDAVIQKKIIVHKDKPKAPSGGWGDIAPEESVADIALCARGEDRRRLFSTTVYNQGNPLILLIMVQTFSGRHYCL